MLERTVEKYPDFKVLRKEDESVLGKGSQELPGGRVDRDVPRSQEPGFGSG